MHQRMPKTGCRTCSCADPGWLGRLATFQAAAGAAARCDRSAGQPYRPSGPVNLLTGGRAKTGSYPVALRGEAQLTTFACRSFATPTISEPAQGMWQASDARIMRLMCPG